ncbi:cytochrome P450 [Streptomyces sp. NPDC041068]|uniref:cytochrome P450 family protein n=1 Tax=Streptomyces sp. NPDC041068 TaxID=3155130 RepID=UPI0033CC051E
MSLAAVPLFLLDPLGQDHHAEGARLRAEGPVVAVEMPGGVAAWLVTRQEIGRQVLADARFAKDPALWGAWRRGEVAADWPLAPLVTMQNMTTATGADHRRLRTPLARAFTARRVRDLEPRVTALTDELLDGMAQLPARAAGEPVDLRACFAHPLPIRVICELFGVPADRAPRVRALCAALFGTAASPEEAAATHAALREALAELIEERRARPGGDLTTALVAARNATASETGTGTGAETGTTTDETTTETGATAQPGPSASELSASELVDTLMLMLVAGHETTVSLLLNAVRALLTHPAQLELLRRGRHSWAAAVEETLRWDPPVANLPFRYARCDVDLAGRAVREGEPVLLGYTSFGRDAEQHGPDADEFDLTRGDTRQHVTFGHGIHHCLGAPLARLEATTALPALFARFPDLSLGQAAPAPLPSLLFNSVRSLPVVLEGARRDP